MKKVDVTYWRYVTELKAELNRPLPGGRGFQHARDKTIHRLCGEIAQYDTPER